MTVNAEHAELNEHLNAYLDGALDEVTLRRLKRHLETCERCRADLDELRMTRDVLRALPVRRAPRPFTIPATPEAGGAAVVAGPPAAPWLAWAWRLGSLGAAACLLLAVVTSFATASPGASTALHAELPQERQPATLADRDSAQRAGPVQRQQGAQSEQAASAPAPNPAAAQAAPAADARQERPPASPAAPGATPWLALATVLGAGSAALFVLDRRARARAP